MVWLNYGILVCMVVPQIIQLLMYDNYVSSFIIYGGASPLSTRLYFNACSPIGITYCMGSSATRRLLAL